jgi:galactonate dehydratase
MQVRKVTSYLANAGPRKTCVFAKVETDTGLHGWGEAFARPDREQPIERHINAMSRYLVGRSPFTIKHFCQVMYLDYAGKRRGYDFTAALSALEPTSPKMSARSSALLEPSCSIVRRNAFP